MGETSSIEQLKKTYEAIREHNKVNLFGPPGVGKTWMANRVGHRCAREPFFQVILWVFLCRKYTKKSLSESIGRQLGLLPTETEQKVDDDDDSEGEKEDDEVEILIKKLREKLQTGKILLFLDQQKDQAKERYHGNVFERLLRGRKSQTLRLYDDVLGSKDHATDYEIEDLSDYEDEKRNEKEFWLVWTEISLAPNDNKNLHTVFLSRSRRGVNEIDIEVKALPKEECESLLIQKLDARLTASAVSLGKRLIAGSDCLPGTVIVIAKAFSYFGLRKSGVTMLEKELEEASEVKSLLCKMHNVLPIGVLKDLCQPYSHFFRHPGSIHYNELITYWILEGYLGFGSVMELYEKGHRVLVELMDWSILKGQEGGYVFMDKSLLSIDDLYPGVDQLASLGLATAYTSETQGFGMIMHEDGILKAAQTVEDPYLTTLLLDGTHFNEQDLMGFLEFQKELQLLALFNPTLKSLPQPLHTMKSLRVLVLRGCEFLQDVILPLNNLLVLEISGARSLKKIPFKFFKNMLKLQSLHLSQLPITFLPSSIYRLTQLRWLIVKDCHSLKKITRLSDLQHLRVLDLSGNTSLASMDKNLVKLQKLRSLNLSNTMIPATPILKNSTILTHLLLRNCKGLERLRKLASLKKLQTLDLSGSTLCEDFHDASLESLISLRTLNLSGTNLDLQPFKNAKLRYLYLRGCTRLEELSCMVPLVELEILDASGSKNLNKIHRQFFKQMTRLRVLNLSKTSVAELPSMSDVSNLRELLLSGCASLVRLPALESATKLEVLDVSYCWVHIISMMSVAVGRMT